MADLVECHSGYAYAERPVALYWQSQRLKIAEILAEWRSSQGRHFRVSTEDHQTFELLYDEAMDGWRIRQH